MKRIRIMNFDTNNHCNGCNRGDYDLRLCLEVEFCNDQTGVLLVMVPYLELLCIYIDIPPTTVSGTAYPTTVCA